VLAWYFATKVSILAIDLYPTALQRHNTWQLSICRLALFAPVACVQLSATEQSVHRDYINFA